MAKEESFVKETHPEVVQDLIQRMRKIEGQARGIQRMLEEDASCEAILIQLSAMRSAINKVGMKAIGCHLGSKMAEELARGGKAQDAVDEIMEAFLRFS